MGLAIAQNKMASGIVLDENDDPITGASVIVKGTTTIGTVTDANGKFSLSIPSSVNTLVVKYLGYTDKEAPASTNMQVRLEPDTKKLDEVVVTAFGMTRSSKSVGYATSTVKSEELTQAIPTSVMSGLAGKVAGVNITTGGGTGTAQKVIIRGYSSLPTTSGGVANNNPLYVIDGVPVRSSFAGTTNSTTLLNNTTDYGSQVGDINPEDVASVTVLKGASATALYGGRAANGVILITTKRGLVDSKVQVEYNGTVSISNVLRTPKLQNMFGEGWPLFDEMENGSWGPKLDGIVRTWGAPLDSKGVYDPVNGEKRSKPFEFVNNNIRDFYKNGLETVNNVSISGGTKSSSYVFSYNNTFSNGIIPDDADKYSRNTFSFRGNSEYKRFKAKYIVNYSRKDINQVRGGQGQAANGGATTFQNLVQIPVDISISRDLKDISNPYNNTDNYFTPYADNPYWIIKNNTSTYQDDHVYGNFELSLELMKGLTAIGRLGGDFMNYHEYIRGGISRPASNSWQAYGQKTAVPGYYEEFYRSYEQIDATALLNADYELNKDFHVTGFAGWNFLQLGTSYLDSYLAGLNVDGWYSLENGTTLPNTTSFPKSPTKRVMGLLGQGDISYQNWAFLGISLRNDWSSSLPINSNSFFYWGVNASVILTDAIQSLKNNSTLSFLKLRGGWGQTGNDADPYYTNANFSPTKIALGFGNLYLPLNNVAGLMETARIPNKSLRPEITTELEFGMDARFFNNRLGIDVAWYDRDTKDQIIAASISPETGYTSRVMNMGLVNNSGVELHLTGTPVKTKDFSWDLGVTFSKNKSKVEKLWGDAHEYLLASAYDVTFKAIVGQPLGVFQIPKIREVGSMGTDDKSSPDLGKTVVNSSGLPIVLATEFETLGTSAPDFLAGFSTAFTFKGLTFSALVDWHKGGLFYSNTARMLDWNGNGPNTMYNERQPFLVSNSVKLVSEATATKPAVYAENDIPISFTQYWNYTTSNKGMESNAVLDRSFVKLREITVRYALPVRLLASTPLRKVEIGVFGNNLFMWTAAKNNYVDPEATNYGNDIASELGEFSAAPSVRVFGCNLKVSF
jgi:TonB-linked SusC/RagA family outer membrane protein